MITKQELKNQLREIFIVFLNTSQEKIFFDQISWGLLNEILQEFGYTQNPESDFDTNGWQIDFWVDYIKDNKVLDISGSLWYGNITIIKKGKNEKEDED